MPESELKEMKQGGVLETIFEEPEQGDEDSSQDSPDESGKISTLEIISEESEQEDEDNFGPEKSGQENGEGSKSQLVGRGREFSDKTSSLESSFDSLPPEDDSQYPLDGPSKGIASPDDFHFGPSGVSHRPASVSNVSFDKPDSVDECHI